MAGSKERELIFQSPAFWAHGKTPPPVQQELVGIERGDNAIVLKLEGLLNDNGYNMQINEKLKKALHLFVRVVFVMISLLTIANSVFSQKYQMNNLSIVHPGNTSVQKLFDKDGLKYFADTVNPNKWRILLEPYFMFPNMKGAVGLGSLPNAEVDEDPSDIFENLQFGAMLYAEVYNQRWAITSDFTYMSLGSDISSKNGIITGDAAVKQLAWELALLRKLKPWLEAGVGFQLNNIKSDINLVLNAAGNPTANRSRNETWVDPSFIARAKLPLSGKWFLQFRGNIGGFGIGSDFYWQLQGYAGIRFSKLFQLSAGYRVIDMDYEKGTSSDRFKYDMRTFGPVIRLGFNL